MDRVSLRGDFVQQAREVGGVQTLAAARSGVFAARRLAPLQSLGVQGARAVAHKVHGKDLAETHDEVVGAFATGTLAREAKRALAGLRVTLNLRLEGLQFVCFGLEIA